MHVAQETSSLFLECLMTNHVANTLKSFQSRRDDASRCRPQHCKVLAALLLSIASCCRTLHTREHTWLYDIGVARSCSKL